jgi:hypothetical protein
VPLPITIYIFLFKQFVIWKRSLCTFEAVQRDGSKSTPCAANPCQSADPILHREPPLLKNRSNATADFKNLKRVGVPLFGPNLSFKVIISKSFSWECPFKRNNFTMASYCTTE